MNVFKKATLATALAASAVVGASPAMARDYYGHRGGDTAGAAIAGGIIGLALGAIIASSDNDRHDRDYRNGYRYRNGYHYRDGYYYDRDGYRYDRHRRDGRDYYYRRGYRDDGYYRGY